MSNERQQMILRRTMQDAPSSAEVALRVNQSAAVTLLDETPPSYVLVEGTPDTISSALAGLSGWMASPVVNYQVPNARPRILKPAAR